MECRRCYEEQPHRQLAAVPNNYSPARHAEETGVTKSTPWIGLSENASNASQEEPVWFKASLLEHSTAAFIQMGSAIVLVSRKPPDCSSHHMCRGHLFSTS